jgi:hypothetical protein
MEKEPRQEYTLAESLWHPEQWQEALARPEYTALFDELVGTTQQNISPEQVPWVTDPNEVTHRWQYLVEKLGHAANSHGHPVFDDGARFWKKDIVGFLNKDIVYPVEGERTFVEAALILTHHYAVRTGDATTAGLSVTTHYRSSPEFTWPEPDIFDLRDMHEPISVMGTLSLEDFALMSEAEQEGVWEKIKEVNNGERFGYGGGWFPTPQMSAFIEDQGVYNEYQQLIKYGTNDKDEIRKQYDERKQQVITELRSQNSEFGKIPESYAGLTKRTKECVVVLFEYFDYQRDRWDHISIDTYSMGNYGLNTQNLKQLIAKEVLVNERQVISPTGWLHEYDLAQDYYECWVARHYPVPDQDQVESATE